MVAREIIIIFFISFFSFLTNFYFASRGVFPVDTFIHYDSGYRILLGEFPVKDYWIVHGFIIDFFQALFFFLLGNTWHSYVFHSSIINLVIGIFSYNIFRILNLNIKNSLILTICLVLLSYPTSGTPFLDLHSTFFSLFAAYFIILFLKNNNKEHYWIYVSFFLCLAFFSKQVPATYHMIQIFFLNIYISFIKKNLKIFFYFLLGGILFITLILLIILITKISFNDFIIQYFLFPKSIGLDRYSNYILGFKNIFLDYKFIYFLLIPMIIINLFYFIKRESYYNSSNFIITILIVLFVFASIFHQIYTKNQIFIFFLIPLLSGILISNLIFFKFKKIKFYKYLILIFCIFCTIKYSIRFDINRKFHELSNTNLFNSISAELIDKKLKGLSWISPYNENPIEEIAKIKKFIEILKSDSANIMIISEYSFFSSLTEKKLHSPSRTFDNISYPNINNYYYDNYKKFLIKSLKKNKINKIYFFSNDNNFNENEVIFTYVPQNCFKKDYIDNHILLLSVNDCESLK